MSRFAGLGGVKTKQGGIYFKDGDFLVQIEEVKMNKDRSKIDQFIATAKVLESSNPAVVVGSVPSWLIKLKPGETLEYALGDVKAFCGLMVGIADVNTFVPQEAAGLQGEQLAEALEKFWATVAEFAVGPTQPFKGARVKLNCVSIEAKKTPGKFWTKHVWGPVVERPAAA